MPQRCLRRQSEDLKRYPILGIVRSDDPPDISAARGVEAGRGLRDEELDGLPLEVKAINVTKDQAQVQYFFDVNYEIPGPDNTTQWKRETDTKEMTLKLEGSMWRIICGI